MNQLGRLAQWESTCLTRRKPEEERQYPCGMAAVLVRDGCGLASLRGCCACRGLAREGCSSQSLPFTTIKTSEATRWGVILTIFTPQFSDMFN